MTNKKLVEGLNVVITPFKPLNNLLVHHLRQYSKCPKIANTLFQTSLA